MEPYVVAADVYTAEGQHKRGGWTWYTGSASWIYRIGLESILGFVKRGSSLVITPSVPAAWREYRIEYRYGRSTYDIVVASAPDVEVTTTELDGVALEDNNVELVDDGQLHTVRISRASADAREPGGRALPGVQASRC